MASLAVTRMPPPMSTMTDVVGDDGAKEVERYSIDNIISAAMPRGGHNFARAETPDNCSPLTKISHLILGLRT